MGPINSGRRVYIVETNRCYSSGAAIGIQLEDTRSEHEIELGSAAKSVEHADLTKSADSRYSSPM